MSVTESQTKNGNLYNTGDYIEFYHNSTPSDNHSHFVPPDILTEFLEGSGIARDVFEGACQFIPDVWVNKIGPGGDVLGAPWIDALGWVYTPFPKEPRHAAPALVFLDPDGGAWQFKFYGGKDRGYRAPKGNGDIPYLPPIPRRIVESIADRYGLIPPGENEHVWEWIKRNPQIRIIITEGAKKALSIISQGIPAIALYGYACGLTGNQIKPELLPYVQGRENVDIAFDCGDKPKTQRKVKARARKFAEILESSAGVGEARIISWSGELGKGIDDLIVSGVENFWSALNAARPPKTFRRYLEKLLTPRRAIGAALPPTQGEQIEGDRGMTWAKKLAQGVDVLDVSFMGEGKTWAVPGLLDHVLGELGETPDPVLLGENFTGPKLIFCSPDPRNPPVPMEGFAPLWPRNQYGFYRGDDGRLIKADKDTDPGKIEIQGNCKRAAMFESLENKGYEQHYNSGEETLSPICQSCPFLNKCLNAPGWYLHDKRKSMESDQILCHIEALPPNIAGSVIVIDEASQQLSPTKTVEGNWGDMLTQLDNWREKLTPEHYQFLDNLTQTLKPLLAGNQTPLYGYTHDQILEALGNPDPDVLQCITDLLYSLEPEWGEVFVESDGVAVIQPETVTVERQVSVTVGYTQNLLGEQIPIIETRTETVTVEKPTPTLSPEERKKYAGAKKSAEAYFRGEAYKQSWEKLRETPPNLLPWIIRALAGEPGVVLRIDRGRVIITIDRRPRYQTIFAGNRVVALDATITPEKFKLLTGVDRPLAVVKSGSDLPLANLTVTQIITPGLGSGDFSPTAINRIETIFETLGGDFPVLTHKSMAEKLNTNAYWFRDSRGSNQFQGEPKMMLVGTPFPNVGAISDQYRALTGGTDGGDNFYAGVVNEEVLQALGRQRANRSPDKSFGAVLLTGDNYDARWLEAYGVTVTVKHAWEINPAAGDLTQAARWRLSQGVTDLVSAGAKVTQAAVGKVLGTTQQAVSALLRDAGVTLETLVNTAAKSLGSYTTPPTGEPYRAGCEDLAAWGWFLNLAPGDVLEEIRERLETGGLPALAEFVGELPKIYQPRVWGMLWGVLKLYPDPSPPPALAG